MITLAVPTLRRYDLLKKLVASAEAGSRVPDRYFIIDNGDYIDASGFVGPKDRTIILRPRRNLGVAASFNLAVRENEDHLILSNDDVVLGQQTIELLVAGAERDPDTMFFAASDETMFALFLQRRALLERIGEYDESFWPAYFEDNDYMRRMRLAAVPWKIVRGANYEHAGSATIQAFSKQEIILHHRHFEENKSYYIAKWGGEPGRERFEIPKAVWKKSELVEA